MSLETSIEAELTRLRAENRRLEHELSQARQFQTMLELMPQTFSRVDLQGRITYTSPVSFKVFGYTEADFLAGVNVFQMVIPEDIPRVQAGIQAALEKRGASSEYFTAKRKDGSTFPCLIYTTPMLKDGQFDGFYAIVADITTQKQIETQLRTSQDQLTQARAFLESALDQTPAAIVIVRAPDLVVLQANRAARELLGPATGTDTADQQNAAEAMGSDLEFNLYEPNGRPLEAEALPLRRVVRQGWKTHNQEFILRQVNGNERWVLVNAAPVFGADGQILAAIQVMTDVTDRHRAEGEILKVQKLESLGVLAGGIAHDFNNLLTAIIGNLNLVMLDTTVGDARTPLLTDIETAANLAQDLTLQLLTFSRGGEPVKTITRLEDLIRSTTSILLRGSAVSVTYDFGPGLFSAAVDAGQLGQVIQNLVLNALQAMPDGGHLTLSAHNQAAETCGACAEIEGDCVKIEVRDTGHGIAPEHLDKIFDPYFSTRKQGHGLGLAVVFSVIRKHQGQISVQSQPGRGTVFTILLPAHQEDGPTGPLPDPLVPHLSGRVLVMDDEAGPRLVLTRMLEKLGLTVVSVAEGQSALMAFDRAQSDFDPFNFAILDLTIQGGMGGLETLGCLHQRRPDFPALVCSGYSNDPVLADPGRFGFSLALKKPFNLEELKLAVWRMLRIAEGLCE